MMHRRIFVAVSSLSIAITYALSMVCVNAQGNDDAAPKDKSVIQQKEYQSVLQTRTTLIQKLIETISESKDDSYQGSMYYAVKLLGDLRAREGIDTLSEHILFVPKNYVTDNTIPTEAYYVCAKSLIQIGEPSIEKMVFKIRWDKSLEERNLAAWVIMEIDGKEQAMCRLDRMQRQNSGENKKNLEAALAYIREYKPSMQPPSRAILPRDESKR